MEKWVNHTFISSSYTTDEFKAFASDFKKAISKKLPPGFEIVNYSVGHFYVSGFIKSGGKYWYFSIPDVRHFKNEWYTNILIRTAENEKDYMGGVNSYISLKEFGHYINRLIGR